MRNLRGAAGGLHRLTVVFAVTGIVVSVVFAGLTLVMHRRTNQRLLDLQVKQAASTLAAALPILQGELEDGVQVATTGGPTAFARFASTRFTPGPNGFRSVSLWRQNGDGVVRLALLGAPPALVASGRMAFLDSLRPSTSLSVTGILRDPQGAAIGYAELPPGGSGLVVYAESALPPDRKLVLPKDSPFGDLAFAAYLGSDVPSHLIETSIRTPVTGQRSSATAPFGDTVITLVGKPTTDLAGGMSAALPWVVLAIGTVLSVFGAAAFELLARRRLIAELLAEENQSLYLEQRNIASTLQHALLPDVPKIEGLEVVARYLPGTAGMEVGGDWYDVIAGPAGCTFVVGDVTGRGLRAASVMAALRFATRAFVAEGSDAVEILDKLARLPDIGDDDQFATVLVGQIDVGARRLRLASAGHPSPVLVEGRAGRFLEVPTHSPIGVPGQSGFSDASVDFPAGSALIAYTDGLVERRGESIADGLERLLQSGLDAGRPADETIERLTEHLIPDGATDDTALLVIRWRDAV